MAITSAGYFGATTDVQWAQLFEALPHWFRSGSFAPSAVAGNRRVALTAGVAFGGGIRDTSSAVINVDLTPPGSGGIWYLLVLRRSWSVGVTGTTSVQALTGPTTSGTTPTAPPTVLPTTTLQTAAGTSGGDDASIAWVHVRAADTTLAIFDARVVINGTGTISTAFGGLNLLPLLSTLPAGVQIVNNVDAITYRWNGTTWDPWDSDWFSYIAAIGGINGGYGASPGFVSAGAYRYLDGLVNFRGSFFLNGGTAASTGQLTIGLPVNAATVAGSRLRGLISAFNNSDTTSGSPAEYALTWGFTNSTIYLGAFPNSAGKNGAGVTGSVPFGEAWTQSDSVTWDLTYDPA